MSNGWVKIHRSIWDNPYMQRPNVLSVWLYILCHVVHQPTEIIFEGKRMVLQAGQGVFRFTDVAEIIGVPAPTVYRIVDLLKSEKQIEKQKTPRNTLITVLNWCEYQTNEKQSDKQMRNKRETNDKQMRNLHYYTKNDKNEKNDKNTTTAEEEPQKSEYKSVIDAWNSLPLHNIVSLNGKRLDSLKARIKEYSLDDVLKAISIIQKSPFLLGQNNRGWQITVDWFLKPSNFPKVLEGNYLPKTEELPKEDRFEKVLSQPKKGESILFMDIVKAYKQAKENGETRTLQEFAEEYRQKKRGELNGVSGTA